VGSEEYAFKIKQVVEVVRMVLLKKIPQLPEIVEGVFNLRGLVVMVIDLRKRFGVDDFSKTKSTRIIITAIEEKKIGFIVDSINSIEEISQDDVSLPSEYPVDINEDFISSIVNSNGKILPVLNIQEILSAEEKRDLLNVTEEDEE